MALKRDILLIAFLGLNCVLIAANLLLRKDNSELRTQVKILRAVNAPLPGTPITKLQGYDDNGKAKDLDFTAQHKDSLLFVFSVDCPYTKSVLPQWKKLMRDSNANIVFVETSGEVKRQFFSDRGMAAPENLLIISPQTRSQNRLAAVPSTVLINRDGKVMESWIGDLDHNDIDEIHRAMLFPN